MKILLPRVDSRSKWPPNYEGPYIVKILSSDGGLIPTTMDGGNYRIQKNSDAVKNTMDKKLAKLEP